MNDKLKLIFKVIYYFKTFEFLNLSLIWLTYARVPVILPSLVDDPIDTSFNSPASPRLRPTRLFFLRILSDALHGCQISPVILVIIARTLWSSLHHIAWALMLDSWALMALSCGLISFIDDQSLN